MKQLLWWYWNSQGKAVKFGCVVVPCPATPVYTVTDGTMENDEDALTMCVQAASMFVLSDQQPSQ